MTPVDRDRRHRWAETCERLAEHTNAFVKFYGQAAQRGQLTEDAKADLRQAYKDATDLREIAAYLRAPPDSVRDTLEEP